MNNQELKQILHRLKIPAPAANSQNSAKYHALIALQNQANESPQNHAPFFTKFRVTACCVLATLILTLTTISQPTNQLSVSRQTLAQIEKLFPHQLNAVIERNGNTRIELAEQPSTALTTAQPLIINLERNGKKISILSFSGRPIRLTLDGQTTCLEALATASGEIIISAGNFLWTPETPNQLLGYNIQAQPLIAKL